jgi:hypothetical protein
MYRYSNPIILYLVDFSSYCILPTIGAYRAVFCMGRVWRMNGWQFSFTLFDGFQLLLPFVERWCLRGSLLYGESVEDEWMAVGLLRRITQQISTLGKNFNLLDFK